MVQKVNGTCLKSEIDKAAKEERWALVIIAVPKIQRASSPHCLYGFWKP